MKERKGTDTNTRSESPTSPSRFMEGLLVGDILNLLSGYGFRGRGNVDSRVGRPAPSILKNISPILFLDDKASSLEGVRGE